MISFKNLKEILDIPIRLETKLKDFYDVAEIAMKNEESRKAVIALRDRHTERLEVLRNVDVERFGKTEWVRYAPDLKEEDLIPVKKVTRDAEPNEIFRYILIYEQKLKSFYSELSSKLVVRNQKELLESLAAFKSEQAEEIKRLMHG